MKKKVLFFAEGVSLSHLARSLGLASRLDPNRYQVTIATPYWNWPNIPMYNSRIHVDSIRPNVFNKRLAYGKPLYTEQELEQYISDDLRTFEFARPDIVVGDFRLSLAISARTAQIPLVTVTNAYWSPLCQNRLEFPTIFPWSYFLPVHWMEKEFHKHQQWFLNHHLDVYNGVRSKHGVHWKSDLRAIYSDGDIVCFADIPGLFKLHPLPNNTHIIGPVLWQPESARLPDWWVNKEFGKWTPPIGYASIGSTGRISPLKKVVSALKDRPLYVASSKHDISHKYVADYLPGIEACAHADYVICNGGSMSTQQALLAGKPVIGIVHNMDQATNMAAIESAGFGLSIRADRLTKKKIRNAVEYVTTSKTMRKRCEEFFATYDHASTLRQFEKILDHI